MQRLISFERKHNWISKTKPALPANAQCNTQRADRKSAKKANIDIASFYLGLQLFSSMAKLQIKRSNILENGQAKEPTAPLMEYGELAVNYNADDPVLFIKNSEGDVIRLIAPGYDGAKGAKGNEGVKGIKGIAGVKGQKGEEGLKGKQGNPGLVGPDGEEGLKGNKGGVGKSGIDGQKGVKGRQGDKGVKGVGIIGVKGTKGAKGLKGQPTIVGEIIDIIQQPGPPTEPCGTNGSVIIDSNSDAWICNDGVWNNIGKIVGPEGQPGIQGEKGLKGLKGVKGTPGAAGGEGNQGDKGNKGEKGTKGLSGLKGNRGQKGIKGIQGIKGIKGREGLKGNIGADGEQGEAGIKGVKGKKGIKGNEGPRGFGDKGAKGAKGIKGYKGSLGSKGNKGTQGIKGISGTIGNVVGYWDFVGPPAQPADCSVEGNLYIDSNSDVWTSLLVDGSCEWQNLGPIKGPQGDKGEKGFGEKGATGPQGQGTKGAKGEIGATGTKGVGEKGIKGEKGFKGVRGAGDKGGAGEKGTKGSTGSKGLTGDLGPKGLKGGLGDTGSKGSKGEKGLVIGVTGEKGIKGQKGEEGEDGNSFTWDDFTEDQLDSLKGEKGEQGDGTSADSFWSHIEFVKAGDDNEYRDSSIFKDTVDDPGKTIRRVYFHNNQLRVELASFSVNITSQGETKRWDEPAIGFTVTVNNPADYPDQYIAEVIGLTDPVGMHTVIADYNTNGPSPAPGGGVTWTQEFGQNTTAKILSNGTGLSGGFASGVLQLADEDGNTSSETSTVRFIWSSCSSSLNVSSLNGLTFLESYDDTSYSVSNSGIADQSNVNYVLTATGGAVSNGSGNGVITFTEPLHKDNASGRSVTLNTTFSRPAGVTGTAYTAADTETETVSASFTYPSWLIATVDRNTPPTLSEVISGSGFTPEVTLKGDEVHRINETVTNSEPVPRALWFAVRSSATQPTKFKVGENANLIFDVEYSTSEIELIPDSPPAGYTAERYSLYGITLQSGNTYISIN